MLYERRLESIRCIVYIRGELYLFYAIKKFRIILSDVTSFVKCSLSLKSFETLDFCYNKKSYAFCVQPFVDSIFYMGGRLNAEEINSEDSVRAKKTCFVFDVNTKTWKKVCSMNNRRVNAASAVFEGRVLICGGFNMNGDYNTVEAYDHVAHEWAKMPNMVYGRHDHKLVTTRNRLFAIGGSLDNANEVYDSFCKKFVVLKQRPKTFFGHRSF